MRPAKLIIDYFWVGSALLQGVVLVAMIRRRLQSQFPVFLAYTAFEMTQSLVGFVLFLMTPALPPAVWAKQYFITLAISTVLRFGVVYEVFHHLFRNYASLERFGKPLFRGAFLAFLVGAVILAFFTRGNGGNHGMFVLHLLEQTANIMLTGLLASLFVFSAYIGLSWRSYAFGIALGMGTYSTVKLAAAALQSYRVASGNDYINLLTMGTFHICVLIWITYLVLPERKPYLSLTAIPTQDVEPWNQELRRLIKP